MSTTKCIELIINGLHWKIYFIKSRKHFDKLSLSSDDEDDMGLTRKSNCSIIINEGLNDDLLIRTVDHEITHAYCWSYGLDQFNNFSEENVADFIESYARNIIRDSDRVIEELLNGRK